MARTVQRKRNDEGVMERFCPACLESHPETLDYWYANPTRPGQFNTPCRACQSAKMAARARDSKAAA